MPTPGSIVGKKSSWPMPRMKTTAALLAPELPAVVLKVRLGTDCATAEIFVAPFCSSAALVIAVTATGVFCSDSERRRAVTPMSPTPWLGASCTGERSEEHTSDLQSLMRISYAVFCLKKKTTKTSTQ